MAARSTTPVASNLAPALVVPNSQAAQVTPGTGDTSKQGIERTIVIEPCPECGEVNFASNAERGRHRRAKHNVQGSSPTAKQRQRHAEQQLNHRETLFEGQTNDNNQRPKSAVRSTQTHPEGSDFAIAYAAGYVASFIAVYSNQAKIPQAFLTEAIFQLLRGEENG